MPLFLIVLLHLVICNDYSYCFIPCYPFQLQSEAQKLWSHTSLNSNTEVNNVINLDKIYLPHQEKVGINIDLKHCWQAEKKKNLSGVSVCLFYFVMELRDPRYLWWGN